MAVHYHKLKRLGAPNAIAITRHICVLELSNKTSVHDTIIDLANMLFSVHIENRFRSNLHTCIVDNGIHLQCFFKIYFLLP